MGYDKKSPAYLVYYPESRRVERVRCVKFFDSLSPENEVLSTDEEVETVPSVLPNVGQNSNAVNEAENEALPEVQEGTTRYPTRARNKPSYLSEYVVESVVDNSINHAVDYCFRMTDVPISYSEAVSSPEAANWKRAMDEEVDSLVGNETFTLVPPPQDREIVGEKWVYTVKTGPNNEETYKARYVAKGYSQIPGVDYHETFAPTARMSSVRVLMQHAVQNNMLVHQMDVITAYLNAPIDCDIFVQQPKCYEKEGENGEKLVCKLNKSLYGLKQSGRNWNVMLHNHLIKEGFTQSLADPCVYVRFVGDDANTCIIIVIWVDDLII